MCDHDSRGHEQQSICFCVSIWLATFAGGLSTCLIVGVLIFAECYCMNSGNIRGTFRDVTAGGLSTCLFNFLSISWTATAAPICVCALFSLVLKDHTGGRSWHE